MLAVSFAVEPFSACYPDARALLERHYAEISTHVAHGFALQPVLRAYHAHEADGSLMVVVGRRRGQIVAYYSCFVAPGLHYGSCLTCLPDIFYVQPEERTALTGVRMLRFVEKELRRRGVKRWAVGTKIAHDAGALFRRLEFAPVEATFEKWL